MFRLVEVGFEKMVNELDVKEAARLGMHTRPLTTAVVQQHLADLGVDPEFGTHSHMRGLSGEYPTRCYSHDLHWWSAVRSKRSWLTCAMRRVRSQRMKCIMAMCIAQIIRPGLTAGSACRWPEGEGGAGSSHVDEPAHAGAGRAQ